MTNNNEKMGIHVGVDVGKYQLDLYLWERDRHFVVSNDEAGIKEAIKTLRRFKLSRIVMEATGRYEMAFAAAAHDKGLPIAIVRPVLVRQFARAADQLAKTDKIDAKIIARFGAVMHPRLTPKKSKNLQLIKDLVVRRRQLIVLVNPHRTLSLEDFQTQWASDPHSMNVAAQGCNTSCKPPHPAS